VDTASNSFSVSFAAYGHLISMIALSPIIPSEIFLNYKNGYYNNNILIILLNIKEKSRYFKHKIILFNLDLQLNTEFAYRSRDHIYKL